MEEYKDESEDYIKTIKDTYNETKDLQLTILKCLRKGIYVSGGGVEPYNKRCFMKVLGFKKYKIDSSYAILKTKGYIKYCRYGGQCEYGEPYVYGQWEILRKGYEYLELHIKEQE